MAMNLLVGSMVQGSVQFLLEKMSSMLEREASLLGGVRKEVEEIKRELESIRSFLIDVDRVKESNEGIRTWTMQIREVSYEVEDIIDEFLYHFERRKRDGIMGVVHTIVHLPSSIFARHTFANRLQGIKAKVHNISERRSRYRLHGIEELGTNSNGADEGWRHQGYSSLFIDEDDIVGIDHNREILIDWLTEEGEEGEENRRMILSVVGMGGLGKSTLVNKAYNNQIVKRHFDCYAWISVSQSYKIEELLRNMWVEFFKAKKEATLYDIGAMNCKQLVEMLIDHLQSKRYVVVLDDVWSVDVWNSIKMALPDNIYGSRIMVTTRNVDVASSLGEGSDVFHLEPLSSSDSWILFCKKAFWSAPNKSCPQELEPLAQTIVDKCEGLPLAIVALGGLMSSKDTTEVEWRKVYMSLSWEWSNNPLLERVKSILLLSFNDLPHYLKYCFFYCSLFPEDYVIKRKRLIRLWVAEGFIGERRGMSPEEVADVCLKELVCRSMLQVVKMNYFGRVKACRVHDIVRDFALVTCQKENFCMVYGGQEALEGTKPRRLSIHKSDINLEARRDMPMSHCRSFLCFVREMFSSSSLFATLSNFRLLRVLDLQGVLINKVPNELVALFNLRYLSLKATKVRELPKSFASLQNLETLDIRDTCVERLPRGINKMLKLRHLLIFRYIPEELRFPFHFSYITGLPAPRGLGNLRSLQTLTCVIADKKIVQEIGNMSQLRRFSIINVSASHGENLSASIQRMTLLLYLIIMTTTEEEPLKLENLSPPPPLLQKLILGGRLDKFPRWISSLLNLSFISLHCSMLREDPLPLLGSLPNLMRLLLQKACYTRRFVFLAGWFPKLRTLSLWELNHLNGVEIEEGAMPKIQQLWMGFCEDLKVLPQGIEHLTTLKQLYLEEMPKELVESMKQRKDRHKIQHIPSIKCSNRDKSRVESLS